jgi:UDP-N-acetylmuramate--alanine ligase
MGKTYYFCGVGGAGMSPLARLLAAHGETVIGSDRSNDRGRNRHFFEQLRREGIRLVPQDGSFVSQDIGAFIVTRAVEESIPDIRRARELGIPLIKRPALMADIFATTRNIAVAGTSGKSTTTGMIGFVLDRLGLQPTVMNGAEMIDFDSSFRRGGDRAVFEADESDGLNDVVATCPAEIGVLTNISHDHFELAELETIFGTFVHRAKHGVVLNADCPISMRLRRGVKNVVTFGFSPDADITPAVLGGPLSVRGEHNVANALAALAVVRLLGLDMERAAESVRAFRGIRRRLELVAHVDGIKYFDDFASNPGKIAATLKTLQAEGQRLIVVFQPHGFQPTKMMLSGYIETFARLLRQQDLLVVTPIYYVGGTANVIDGSTVSLPTDISGNDIVAGVCQRGGNARSVSDRAEVPPFLSGLLSAGDVVVSMGSRDETLPEFARGLAGCSVSRR